MENILDEKFMNKLSSLSEDNLSQCYRSLMVKSMLEATKYSTYINTKKVCESLGRNTNTDHIHDVFLNVKNRNDFEIIVNDFESRKSKQNFIMKSFGV